MTGDLKHETSMNLAWLSELGHSFGMAFSMAFCGVCWSNHAETPHKVANMGIEDGEHDALVNWPCRVEAKNDVVHI